MTDQSGLRTVTKPDRDLWRRLDTGKSGDFFTACFSSTPAQLCADHDDLPESIANFIADHAR
jgi:hypothetical protein